MNPWELTDKEIRQVIIESDKKIWACKPYPRWEGEKYLMKVAQKKLVEHLKRIGTPIEDSDVAPQKQKTDWLIPEDKWQALCKKLEVK